MAVVVDASPLLGRKTGVAEGVELLLRALATQGFPVRAHAAALRGAWTPPADLLVVPSSRSRVPHRLLLRTWQRLEWPPVEALCGTCDVFHATNFYPPPARGKVLATVHDVHFMADTTYGEAYGGAWFREALPQALGRAIGLVVPSEATKTGVRRWFPDYEGEIFVVPWGMEVSPPRMVPLHDPPTFVAIGTLERRKNYPLMLEAFARLNHPEAKLVIIGGDGGEEASLRARASGLEVSFAGYLSEDTFRRTLAGAVALVSSSVDEGFCLPLLHAFNEGVPAVATEAGALPEVIGDAGLLVPLGDAEAMAQALGALIGDTALRRALAVKARQRAEAFSLEAMGEAMVKVYRWAMEAPTR